MNGIVRQENGHLLSLNSKLYSVETIKKTAYKFADRASIILTSDTEQQITVLFNFTGCHALGDPDQVIADFCNELLDQDLREAIKRESEPLRNLLLAHAFSRTSLVKGN